MKFAFYTIGLLLGFGFGFFPGILKPKPLFSKIVAVFFITLTTFLALYPPSVATLQDVVISKNIPNAVKKLNVVVEPNWNTFSESTQSVALWSNNQHQEIILLAETPEVLKELKAIKGTMEKVLVTAYAGNTHLDFYIS